MDRILQESLELRTPYEPIPPYMGRILSESFEFRTPSESQFPRLCRQSIAPPVIILHVPRIRVMKRDIGHGAPTAEVPRVTETKLDIGNDGTTAEFLRMGAMEPGFENDGAILPTVSQLKFRKDGKNPRPSSKKSRYFSLSPITVQIAETDSSPARTEKYASKAQAISALYDQGPDKLSNFCTFDVTNRIIRTYRYGVEHPDEEELRQNGLETMWLPIHGVHDRLLGGLTGENVSKTARRKDVSLLRDDCECLMGSSRDVSMAFVTDTPWTQNSLEKLGSEASLTRRNSRYDAETEFLNRAGTMSESSLGTGYLSHALATMVTSGPENDCLSRDSTMRKSYRSTLASDRGRAILDDDDFFMEVDPELARSYLGSQYSQSPRTSLLDIERLQEEEHITDPNVRRELQGVYETLSSEWAAPERGWIDLDRSYLSDSSQIDLAQPGQEGTFNEENLATRKVSFRCCSSNRPCVEHSEDGVDTTASLDDSPQQDVDTGYVVNPFRTQTTAKPVEIVSHRRRSSSEIPYAEHIEDVALEQMSLGNSLQQGVQASPEVNVRRRATAMLVKIVSPMPHQPMYLQHAEESFCSAGANTKEKGRNRSLTIPADNCDIPKSLQSRERTISHSAYPVAGLDSVATTSRTSDSPSKKTHRRSRLYCSISRDREWPSYATVRRSPRRRAFQSDLRKEFAEMPFASVINGADNVDDRRPSSADSFTSGYHFSKVGDYMVEREQVADIIQDAKTELAANNQELVKGFLKTTTELVADDDKIPNVINDIEPFKAHESPSLRLKPVTAEDLNLKIVGKAARNSQLAKKKTKKVGALVDIFQAHGLMPGIMGPKRYGMSSPSFAHHSSGRPASVSPRVVSRSGTVYGTAGTGCVASTGSRQYSPIKGIPTPFSYPMRLSSSISYTDTEVSSMFGEPLEEVNRHEDEDKEEIHPDIRVTVASSSKIPRVRWIVGDSGDDTYPLSFSDSEQLEEVVKYEDEDKNEGICPDARAVIENSAKMPVPDVL